MRARIRTTRTRSANGRSCTGRRRSGSPVGESSNWPGVGVDDIDLIDVYSCFPSAVQVAAAELGLPLADAGRPLTVTGGLTFAGGPWNNYVTHSIATMAERLAGNPGQLGLITANGGWLTKHSFGVYGSEPPEHEFRWEDVQSAVDAEPTRTAEVEWTGVGTVEAWTTPFDRNGSRGEGVPRGPHPRRLTNACGDHRRRRSRRHRA